MVFFFFLRGRKEVGLSSVFLRFKIRKKNVKERERERERRERERTKAKERKKKKDMRTSADGRRRAQRRQARRGQARPPLGPDPDPVEVEPRRPQGERLLQRKQGLSAGPGVARAEQRRRERVGARAAGRQRQGSAVRIRGQRPPLLVDGRGALPAESQGSRPAHGERAGVLDAALFGLSRWRKGEEKEREEREEKRE